jgi:hypothetical protein
MNFFDNAPLAGKLTVLLDADSGTVCKLLGYFAQRGCTPSTVLYQGQLRQSAHGKLIVSAKLGEHEWALLTARAQQTIGVVSARFEAWLPM